MEERLQKYMARCGVDSRRKCEELIADGLVEVNGEVVREPGVKIDPRRDRVKVNGKILKQESPAYYIHYKVKGVTTTVSDDLGRRTVMDCLPPMAERVFPVGRLDRESEGLLVLTNDGALANFLTHPAFGVEKTYRVVAEGRVPEETLRELAEKGMRLGPVLVKPSRVELVRFDNANTVVLISVAEGINREVRRIFAALGHEVKKLLRIQLGPLTLDSLKRGGTRALTPRELNQLKKSMASSGADAENVDELYPPGSAARRKPSGPRGRPRRVKAPRQGKPDPAAHREFAARKKKVDVVEDDWVKRTGPKSPKARRAGKDPEERRPSGRPAARKSPAGKSPFATSPSGRRSAGKAASGTFPSGRPASGKRSPVKAAGKPAGPGRVKKAAPPGKAGAPAARRSPVSRHPLLAPAPEKSRGGQSRGAPMKRGRKHG